MDQSYGDCRGTRDAVNRDSTGGNRFEDPITNTSSADGSATTAADDAL